MHTILPNPTRSQSSVRPYKADSLFLIIHFFNMHMGMQWSLIIYCFSSNIQTVTHPPMSYTLPSLITTIPADLQPVPECGCCGSGGTLPPPLLGTRLEGGHADHHEERRRDDARLTESGNARSEQLLVVPTGTLTNSEWLPGELLSELKR